MNRRNTQKRSERESLTGLLRRPTVQVLLVATAAVQVVATQAGKETQTAGSEVALQLAPAVVTPAADLGSAWREKAIERESQRLAAEYQNRGFQVPLELAKDIHEAASENGIDPELAFGLVGAESSFRNVATSRVGAIGLTQLMPATARWLEPGVTRQELRDPDTNLRIGFRYLKDLIEKYDGNVDLALTAYNRGPGTVDRVLKRGGNPDNGYADFVRTGKKGRHKG